MLHHLGRRTGGACGAWLPHRSTQRASGQNSLAMSKRLAPAGARNDEAPPGSWPGGASSTQSLETYARTPPGPYRLESHELEKETALVKTFCMMG